MKNWNIYEENSVTEFVTSDLQLASYLVALGHRPTRIEGPPHRRCFVFSALPSEDVASYYRGGRPLNPQELFRCYKLMRRSVFEGTLSI